MSIHGRTLSSALEAIVIFGQVEPLADFDCVICSVDGQFATESHVGGTVEPHLAANGIEEVREVALVWGRGELDGKGAGDGHGPAAEPDVNDGGFALGLECVVSWAGWQENIDEWFADKHYIVSTSVIESQGMGILEGMARGLKPVVHNFPGAEQTFTGRYLFNTAEEFCQQILSTEYHPQQYRHYVEEKYPLTEQIRRIREIFEVLGAKTSVVSS